MSSPSVRTDRHHNFSQAFEQMCSVVAMADMRNAEDTLKQLILQCFIIGPEQRFDSSEHISNQMQRVFGLSVPQHQIDSIFLGMVREGSIDFVDNAYYMLPDRIRADLQARVKEATALETRVREEWLVEIADAYLALDGEQVWLALRDYLASAFGRHGLLTIALLDPTIDVGAEQDTSLSALLGAVVDRCFPTEQQVSARTAISDFLNSVVDRQDRARYIAQLADGAFNYFSLTVAPDVSKQLREHLSPLTIFLDTNFLLGILDLHAHSLVEISRQLLRDINKHKLPFKLRFHPVTAEEMRGTLDFYGRRLRSHEWSPALSKVVLERITTISGIERKYHQMNAKSKTSVDAFLKPYERHTDVLLKEKNIDIYRSHLDEEDVSRLSYNYREFAARKRNGKEPKEDATIRHDMILLDTVRQLRSNATSSLQAGALLLTCDSMLCRFDWSNSRSTNRPICTIMPDLLWQMLRPFLLDGQPEDRVAYDRAFAATFAIPEFRVMESSAAREKAKERLITLLAQYRGVSEATATHLITNDLFMTRLESDLSDEEAKLQLENELLQVNTALLEDAVALQTRLELEQRDQEEKSRQLQETRSAYQAAIEQERMVQAALEREQAEKITLQEADAREKAALQRQIDEERTAHQLALRREQEEAQSALTQKERESASQTLANEARLKEIEAQRQASGAENARQVAELKARLDERDREEKERRQSEARRAETVNFYQSIGIAAAWSVGLASVFLLFVAQSTWPLFSFVRNHPHVLGLDLAGVMIIICLAFAIRVESLRKWCLGVGVFSLCFGGLIQIL